MVTTGHIPILVPAPFWSCWRAPLQDASQMPDIVSKSSKSMARVSSVSLKSSGISQLRVVALPCFIYGPIGNAAHGRPGLSRCPFIYTLF